MGFRIQRSVPREFRLDVRSRDDWLMVSGMFGPLGQGTGIGWYVIPPLAILLAITSIMTWHVSKTEKWTSYRRPLYVVAVLAESWIVVVGLTLILGGPVGVGSFTKAVAFFTALGVFWVFTIILASSKIQGKFIPELGRFRPDLIYPTGANLARGEIFAGLGLKLLLTTFPAEIATWGWLPVWNWWGLTWAVIAMVVLVAVRGMVKMQIMMRRTLYGRLQGWSGLLIEEGLLWIGFAGLAYGFLNVFMGYVPFTLIYPRYWPGWILVILSAIILIPIRGQLKLRYDRATMKFSTTVGLQALLYIGILVMFYGLMALFMGEFFGFSSNLGLVLGGLVEAGGLILVVFGRAKSLMHDRKGQLPQMLWMLAHVDDETRLKVMTKRLEVFYRLPSERRLEHMRNMNHALLELPERERSLVSSSRFSALASLPSEMRLELMKTMDKIMMAGG